MWREHPTLASLALSAFVAPDADAQMIWLPGSKEPCATVAGPSPPARFAHAFVMLVKSGERDESRTIEDGAGVLLTAPSFARLRDALVSAQDLTLPLADGLPLRVTFRPEALLDPITGRAMHAVGGWDRDEPKGGRRIDAGRVAVEGITLLLPDAQLAERVDTAALAGFIDAVREATERAALSHPVAAPTPVAVQCTLAPGAPPRVQLAWQGDAPPTLLDPLRTALTSMAPVAVRGEVPFQVEAVVHPRPRGEAS